MLPRRILVIGFQAAAALGLAASAQAACLVLGGGAAIEVRTIPERRGALVVFGDRNGRLTSLRTAEVDLIATEEANRRGVCENVAPGRPFVPAPRASPWRETARPVAIAGPVGLGVHSPTASEILAATRAAGPPRGWSIDCRVVECGKKQSEPSLPAPRATVASRPSDEDASQPSSVSPNPGSRASRKLFGEGFHRTETTESSPPPPTQGVTRQKPPRRGRS